MKESHKMMIKGVFQARTDRAGKWTRAYKLFIVLLLSTLLIGTGCTTARYRKDADKSVDKIIKEKQKQLYGKAEGLSIERPSDILRRRLMLVQELPYSSNASLGTDKLDKIAHWPEKNYPNAGTSSSDDLVVEAGKALKVSLVQALQTAAMNSSDYQKMKESVFQKALDLDLQRNQYGFIFGGEASYQKSASKDAVGKTVKTETRSGSLSASKTLKSGAKIVTSVAADVVSLLTDGLSSKTFRGDASISIPLLRGAGKYVASEPLTQSERDLIYSMYEFERYKNTFAVQVVSSYLNVLSQATQIDNAAENYKNLITSARRTSRLAEAGRATEIEVSQAVQQELTARSRWIDAMVVYKNQFDSLKILLGLPTDANLELDKTVLNSLTSEAAEIVAKAKDVTESLAGDSTELVEPSRENAGPLEMEESKAVKLALENRLDLKVLEGKVYDSQRAVTIRANALGAELTLLGSAQFSGDEKDTFKKNSGIYTGLLTLDLPFERTAERNAYRASYIALEQAVREVQGTEDNIKLSIRQSLRKMSQAREGLSIQTKALTVAEKGAKSADLFFEAGRTTLRDLLEAQSSLLTARNALTSAVINYRMAELEFQRDAGILKIDNKGLLVEYTSEENSNVKLQ
jgi:outer membrane protein TolC